MNILPEIIQILNKYGVIIPENRKLSDIDLVEYGLDSLLFISLLVDLEVAFNIEFDPDDLLIENFRSVDSIKKKVELLTSNKN